MEKTLSPLELRNALDSKANVMLLDVRRAEDKAAGGAGIPGAVWRDPSQVDQWASDIPPGAEVALYCVRGGSVSASVQAELEARGLKARYVEGGLAAWEANLAER